MAEHPQNAEVLDAIRFLVGEIRRLEKKIDALGSASPAAPAIAPDSDLDRPDGRGDPEVRKDPPRWKGEPIAPCRMSKGPAEWLDVVAEFHQWKADNPREGKEKYAQYDRLDAARARGWAQRARQRAAESEPVVPEGI